MGLAQIPHPPALTSSPAKCREVTWFFYQISSSVNLLAEVAQSYQLTYKHQLENDKDPEPMHSAQQSELDLQ